MNFIVTNKHTGQKLTTDEILFEVNRDRSDEWMDYTVEDYDECQTDVLFWIDENYYKITKLK